jgi:hypothetical protein
MQNIKKFNMQNYMKMKAMFTSSRILTSAPESNSNLTTIEWPFSEASMRATQPFYWNSSTISETEGK